MKQKIIINQLKSINKKERIIFYDKKKEKNFL